jgi:hypothetical protein
MKKSNVAYWKSSGLLMSHCRLNACRSSMTWFAQESRELPSNFTAPFLTGLRGCRWLDPEDGEGAVDVAGDVAEGFGDVGVAVEA